MKNVKVFWIEYTKRKRAMNKDIVYNKIEIIKRCLKRINEEYDKNDENLSNFTKQDSIILNLQRACEASIDLAMHLISEEKLGIPQSSRDAFDLLQANNVVKKDLSEKMKRMVGFRNIAVHDYQNINLNILKGVINDHLSDFTEYIDQVLSYFQLNNK